MAATVAFYRRLGVSHRPRTEQSRTVRAGTRPRRTVLGRWAALAWVEGRPRRVRQRASPAMKEFPMPKLTPKQRAKLPARDFGLPEKARSSEAKKQTGNYPIPDRGHAISAKRLSRQQRRAGNLTNEEFERINRKADKVLGAERSA